MDMTLDHFPVHIYWEDTDASGVVYHANYLKFMERARSEWVARLGFDQESRRHSPAGIMFVVASAQLTYRRGARLGDDLVVKTKISRLGRVSIVFDQRIYRGDEEITAGLIKVGIVNADTMAPTPLPEAEHRRLKNACAPAN